MHRGKQIDTRGSRGPTSHRPDGAHRPSPDPTLRRDTGLRVRGLATALLGLGVALLALRLLSTIAARGTGAPAGAARPDDLLLVLLAWVGVVLALWLALGSLLALLAAVPGTAGRVAARLAERITPLAARKALTLVLGASVGSVALPPAPVSSAGSGPLSVSAADSVTAGASTSAELSPGFVPSRAVAAHASPDASPTASLPGPGFAATAHAPTLTPDLTPDLSAHLTPAYVPTSDLPGQRGGEVGPGYVPSAPPPVLAPDRSRLLAPAPRATAGVHDLVTVHRGDSLWSVAARHLGPGAADAQIAREWPRWYAANRDVIGDDPDLLVPGQQLRPPTDLTQTPSIDATAPVPAERGAHR